MSNRDQYALSIEWSEPGLPRLVGPFATREEADEWAETNIPNGAWEVTPLAQPYMAARSRT